MAQIVINEISDNYTYNIGRNSFATVALPITSMWGPALEDWNNTTPNPGDVPSEELDIGAKIDSNLETVGWLHFPATQEGLENFVATYRGPASNYKLTKDYSYQMAMTLLSAGYDVLTYRVCPGTHAEGAFFCNENGENCFSIRAKYPGTFGNNLKVSLTKVDRYPNAVEKPTGNYWSMVVYLLDKSGIQTAVENLRFVFDPENATDTIYHIDEIESKFIEFVSYSGVDDSSKVTYTLLTSKPKDWDTNCNKCYCEKYASESEGEYHITYNTLPTKTPWVRNKYYEKINYDGSKTNNGVTCTIMLIGGSDTLNYETVSSSSSTQDKKKYLDRAANLARLRYTNTGATEGGISYGAGYENGADTDHKSSQVKYVKDIENYYNVPESVELSQAQSIANREWAFTAAYFVYQLLKDKLNYNPQRIISPGWDDQDFEFLGTDEVTSGKKTEHVSVSDFLISPLHKIIMETAYYSRCATGMLDIPRSLLRKDVYNEETDPLKEGYTQKLARIDVTVGSDDVNSILYPTHSALFAPWGQYKYVGTGKQNIAPPAFIALLIQRAQILNQSMQYEWALPTNRKHNLQLGKFDYKVPKKLLDVWQKLEGVGVNVLTEIPELGTNLWGNSTLYEVPPATYQALANLSTRYLVNAVEDIAYKCGISITFQYNNEQAYNKFYAGVTPTLDTMKNVGAIEDYYVRMAADINGLDQVNANTVIGKIYLVVNGVINDIIIDLIALPPGVDLDQFKA